MADVSDTEKIAETLSNRADEIIPGVAQAGALPVSDALALRDWFDRERRAADRGTGQAADT